MLTSQFQGRRLTQAREFRQMTKIILAELIKVVSSTISKWEKNEAEPRPSHLDKLSEILGFDRMFFYRPVRTTVGLDFWRSQSQATRSARERAKSKLIWLKELADYVWNYYETPKVNLPQLRVPKNFEEIADADIEEYANETREHWNLAGPIENIIRTLERNGIIVARCDLLADKLDALSEFETYPFVILSNRKASAVRSRFDASHELGHIIMHRHVTQRDLNTPSKFARIEDQAHRFASAFLLPERHFVRELWAPSLQALRERKEEWGASIGCMLVRIRQLELISEHQYRRLNIQISKRHWRTREPLDDTLKAERPRAISKCLENLVESRIKSPQQILRDLRLPAVEIEEIAALQPGFFDVADQPADDLGIKFLQDSRSEKEFGPPSPGSILEFKLPLFPERGGESAS